MTGGGYARRATCTGGGRDGCVVFLKGRFDDLLLRSLQRGRTHSVLSGGDPARGLYACVGGLYCSSFSVVKGFGSALRYKCGVGVVILVTVLERFGNACRGGRH